MKLAGAVALLFLLLAATANCIPAYNMDNAARASLNYLEELYNQRKAQNHAMMGVQEEMEDDYPDENENPEEMKDYPDNPEDMKDYSDEMKDYPDENEMNEDERMEDDSEQTQKLEEYDDENPSETSEIAVTQSRTISSGDTVALRTYVRDHWLGCSGRHCGRSSCPRMCFEGNDWNNCWGEVFQIYRQRGPGCLTVGDKVGLHYPREAGSWLACSGHHCGKSRCPCHPNLKYGFAYPDLWNRCWGEVYEIYAKGKQRGKYIQEGDEIVLYYPREKRWLAQGPGKTDKRTCLGTQLPPPRAKYDPCSFETFTIHKK